MRNQDEKALIGPILAGVTGGDDGHTRITRGENIAVVGGGQEAHEKAREIAIRANESLDRKDRVVSKREFGEILQEATERSS